MEGHILSPVIYFDICCGGNINWSRYDQVSETLPLTESLYFTLGKLDTDTDNEDSNDTSGTDDNDDDEDEKKGRR